MRTCSKPAPEKGGRQCLLSEKDKKGEKQYGMKEVRREECTSKKECPGALESYVSLELMRLSDCIDRLEDISSNKNMDKGEKGEKMRAIVDKLENSWNEVNEDGVEAGRFEVYQKQVTVSLAQQS